VLPALIAFAGGDLLLQLCPVLPPRWGLASFGAASALAATLAMVLRPGWRRSVAASVAALLLGFSLAGVRAQVRLADGIAAADEGRDQRLRGVVATLPSVLPGLTRFVFEVERQDLAPNVPGRISLGWYRQDAPVEPAQRWEFTVRLRQPQSVANPAGFDGEAWMFAEGVRAVGYVRDGRNDEPPRLLDARVASFDANVDRARASLRGRLQDYLRGSRYGAVIVALVMGDQGPIGEADWTLFNRTGISHLVSISGLHITMIAAMFALAAGALWRRSARLLRVAPLAVVRAASGILGGLAYCLLAGWGVPAQRTLLMLAVVATAHGARVRIPAATVLALAAALVCLWDPWAPLAAGFWLSFGAVACIFLAAAGREGAPAGRAQALREAVRLQGAITIGQVPLTVAIFGQVSLVAPLANAVAIPLVSYLVTPFALAGAAVCALAPGMARTPGAAIDPVGSRAAVDAADAVAAAVAAAIAAAADAAARALLLSAERLFGALAWFLGWLASLPGASLALPLPSTLAVLVAVAGVAWFLHFPAMPLRALGLTWMLPVLLWPAARPPPGQTWVTALDVGQGMAVLVEAGGKRLLFDSGPRFSPDADAGSRVVVPYLRSRGIDALDLVVISHPDIDHAGGAAAVFASMRVGGLLSSVAPGHPLLAGAPPPLRCEAGQVLRLGALWLEVLSPPAALYAQPRASTNARSCVVLARYQGTGVLLTGDVPAREERAIVRASPPERALPSGVDLLLAPHHGSHTSSSAEFLDWAAPRYASVQVGYRSRFGHPHQDVLDRYSARGVCVIRSDASGAAQWRFGARGAVQVERWRLDHPRYWTHRMPEAGSGGDGRCDAPTALPSRRRRSTRRRAPVRPHPSKGRARARPAAPASRTRARAASPPGGRRAPRPGPSRRAARARRSAFARAA
jgi:competence protein ComEC